jgi:hypothetical protein
MEVSEASNAGSIPASPSSPASGSVGRAAYCGGLLNRRRGNSSRGSNPLHSAGQMRDWFNGRMPRFQRDGAGSIPASRSKIGRGGTGARQYTGVAEWLSGGPQNRVDAGSIPASRASSECHAVGCRAHRRNARHTLFGRGRNAAAAVGTAGGGRHLRRPSRPSNSDPKTSSRYDIIQEWASPRLSVIPHRTDRRHCVRPFDTAGRAPGLRLSPHKREVVDSNPTRSTADR